MGREVCYLQFGEGETQVCYNACFHANEWITTPILLKFAEAYAKAYAEGEPSTGRIPRSCFSNIVCF